MSSAIGIRDLVGRPAAWRKVGGWGRRSWRLVGAETELGTLAFPRLFSSAGVAETGEGAWTFRRSGVFRQVVHVGRPGAKEEVAAVRRRWNGEGLLEFPGRRRFRWIREGFWGRRWLWRAEPGSSLVRLHVKAGFRPTATLEVLPEGRRYEEIPLLVTLGWYLYILHHNDTVAAG